MDRGWAAVHRSTVDRGRARGGGLPESSPPAARVDGEPWDLVAVDEKAMAEPWGVRVVDGVPRSEGAGSLEMAAVAALDRNSRVSREREKEGAGKVDVKLGTIDRHRSEYVGSLDRSKPSSPAKPSEALVATGGQVRPEEPSHMGALLVPQGFEDAYDSRRRVFLWSREETPYRVMPGFGDFLDRRRLSFSLSKKAVGAVLPPTGRVFELLADIVLTDEPYNTIQTKENLLKKHCVDSDLCELCGTQVETASHLIAGCPFAADFWQRIGINLSEEAVSSLRQVQSPVTMPAAHFNAFLLLCC
ncbi:hypothetical protein EJB05_00123, partial [Eragrostis curvula]